MHLPAAGDGGRAASQSKCSQDWGARFGLARVADRAHGKAWDAGSWCPRLGGPVGGPAPFCVARPWGWRLGLWEPAGQTDMDSLWFRERRPHPLGSLCLQVGRALEPALTRGTREAAAVVAAATAQPVCTDRAVGGSGQQQTALGSGQRGRQGRSMQLEAAQHLGWGEDVTCLGPSQRCDRTRGPVLREGGAVGTHQAGGP